MMLAQALKRTRQDVTLPRMLLRQKRKCRQEGLVIRDVHHRQYQRLFSSHPDTTTSEDQSEWGRDMEKIDLLNNISLNEEDSDMVQPWKTLLLEPGRARWRVSDHIPESIIKQGEQQTPYKRKQLHSVYQTAIFEPHRALVKQRESERRRLLRNEVSQNNQQPTEAEKSKALPVLYGHKEVWSSLYFRFASNWAVTHRVLLETRALLNGTTNNLGNTNKGNETSTNPNAWHPTRIVDFGMGCASSTIAALDMIEGSSAQVEWIHGIDASETMQQCAKEVLHDRIEKGGSSPPRVTFSSYLSSSLATGKGRASALQQQQEDAPEMAAFDLALCTYTLNELPYGAAALSVVALLWEKLTVNGVLVVIEPGTPDGFSTVRMVRNFLLASNQESNDGTVAHIVAPCTHQGSCPLQRFPSHSRPVNSRKIASVSDNEEDDEDEDWDEEDDEDAQAIDRLDNNDHSSSDADFTASEPPPKVKQGFCSFVHGLPTTHGRGEKFSYLVVQKRQEHQATVREKDDSSLIDILKFNFRTDSITEEEMEENFAATMKAQEEYERRRDEDDDDISLGLDFVDPPESFARIVRAPSKKRGHVWIQGCAAPGRIVRYQVSKAMNQGLPGIYPAGRKSRWGGLWPHIPDLEK